MDDLIAKWRIEQHEIASKTKVLYDSHDEDKGVDAVAGATFSKCSYHIQDKLIGGVDVSFGDDNSAIAVYVITRNQQVIYTDSLSYKLSVPYVSSYLAFREIEPLEQLVERQKLQSPDLTPEVILVDGNGILHERRAGLATFLGVRTGVPTIGVGKTVYCTDGLSVDLVERGVANNLATFAEHCKAIDMRMGMGMGMPSNNCANIASDSDRNGGGNKDDIEMNINWVKSSSYINPAASTCTSVPGHAEMGEQNKRCMGDHVRLISGHCDGFAIPIKGQSGDILAAAIVGHGGKIAGRGKKKQQGTKNPIYVSVGHGISLHRAIGVSVALSLARIPEPVRQADLIGRAIVKSGHNSGHLHQEKPSPNKRNK